MYSHANWKTFKWLLTQLRCTLKFRNPTVVVIYSLVKFVIFLKGNLLCNTFYCFYCLQTKPLPLSNLKNKKAIMWKFQAFLLMLKRSVICCYIIWMNAPCQRHLLSKTWQKHSYQSWKKKKKKVMTKNKMNVTRMT